MAVFGEGRPEPVQAGKEHKEQISEISRPGRASQEFKGLLSL